MKNKHILRIIVFIVSFVYCVVDYLQKKYVVSFEMMIVTLFSDLHGTGSEVIIDAAKYIIPKLFLSLFIYYVLEFFFISNKSDANFVLTINNKKSFIFKIKTLACIGIWCFSILILIRCLSDLGLFEYYIRKSEVTYIYENNYVDPKNTNIISDGDEKNIIFIYLESMESTFMSVEDGGLYEEELIPNLKKLAEENTNFSFSEKVGGFHSPAGTRWTIAAILASQSGLPYSFPIGENGMNNDIDFAPNIFTIGDFLEKEGYIQEFLCGSDAQFGSRESYFRTHGNYIIYDYDVAVEAGKVNDYVWWGFDDKKLYEIAKEELLKLSATGKKFNFTMLTVDTHPSGGYVCDLCENTYENQYFNVINCADSQVYNFVNWIKEQDFYDNTLIVICGDHPSMEFIPGGYEFSNSDKYVYNCLINSSIETENSKNRNFNVLDMFPTVLSAMGFKIEGEKLALGTNLFSPELTLEEQYGYDYINKEFEKYSDFYATNFY